MTYEERIQLAEALELIKGICRIQVCDCCPLGDENGNCFLEQTPEDWVINIPTQKYCAIIPNRPE